MSRWKIFSDQLIAIRKDDTLQDLLADREDLMVNASENESSTCNAQIEHPGLLLSFCFKWHLRTSTIRTDLKSFYKSYGAQLPAAGNLTSLTDTFSV